MANLNMKVCESNNDEVNATIPVYPVIMDSPSTSIVPCSNSSSDDSSVTSDSDDEEWTNKLPVANNNVLPAGANVHIQDSSDVVIGPLTRFHGPVTIYQNIRNEVPTAIDGTQSTTTDSFNNNKSLKSKDIESNTSEKKLSFAEILEKTSAKRLLLYAIITLGLIVVITFGIILSLKKFTHVDSHDGKTVSYLVSERTALAVTNHTIYSRESWGGIELLNGTTLLHLPVEYIVVAHTAGSFCETFSECANRVRNIQTWQNSTGYDIRYNFLIGGDGDIYVGKGWDVMSFSGNNSITVSFIGNFMNSELPPNMLSALQELLQVGVKLNKLRSDYKIVCHNQIQNTFSPGVRASEIISKLPHYFKGNVKL